MSKTTFALEPESQPANINPERGNTATRLVNLHGANLHGAGATPNPQGGMTP